MCSRSGLPRWRCGGLAACSQCCSGIDNPNGPRAIIRATPKGASAEKHVGFGRPVLAKAQQPRPFLDSGFFHAHELRVAHGLAVGDHIGASLAFHAPAPSAQGPFTAWLALAEWLPAGTEGSPVARVLVRNVLTAPIDAQPSQKWPQLWRPMNVPEGAQPARLGVVGWVTDARGQVIALAQARCAAKP